MPTTPGREPAENALPILLVDYENIQDLGLLKKLLPTDFEVRVFVGANQAKIPTEVVKHAQKFLGRKMGDKYKDIVVKCLSGHFVMADDTRSELKLQQAFRAEVVQVLERSLACL